MKYLIVLSAIFLMGVAMKSEKLTVTSPSFNNEGDIPSKFTCEGANINPEIEIKGAPKKTVSFVLIMDDPDAPNGTFDHWIVWNIPAKNTTIFENSVPGPQGINSAEQVKYTGPCPPTGSHRYFFKVYALDLLLDLDEGVSKKDVEDAMYGHILATGQLMGRYEKKDKVKND